MAAIDSTRAPAAQSLSLLPTATATLRRVALRKLADELSDGLALIECAALAMGANEDIGPISRTVERAIEDLRTVHAALDALAGVP